jgi:hypothetical protein
VFSFLVLVLFSGFCSLPFVFGRMYVALTWSVWFMGHLWGFGSMFALGEF